MLGGTLTLIGTSTNILAASILKESGHRGSEIGLFEFTGLGIIVLLAGVLYFVTIGRFLLPDRKEKDGEDERAKRDIFLAEIVIEKDIPLLEKHFPNRNLKRNMIFGC